MFAVIQLVSHSSVKIKDREDTLRSINKGLVVLLGVSRKDNKTDVDKLVNKISKLRIFPDKDQKMNLSITDVQGEILLISQFTLLGDTKGNNRPDFSAAADKQLAQNLYQQTEKKLLDMNIKVKTGFFGEYMIIDQELDGPVTINLDSNYL